MNFSDAKKIGDTERTVREMVKSGKIPGAFIFEGEDEKNKNIISEALAKALVCGDSEYKRKNGEGCGECGSCLKAEKRIHPDIIVSSPEGEGAPSFRVEKLREEIVGSLYLAPNESEKKVYIIQDMQHMSPQCQNTLLKSLEEPPPFAVFIITATSSDLIFETVKSRAVKFSADPREKSPAKNPQAHFDLISGILANRQDRLPAYQNLLSKALDKSGKAEALDFYGCLENALRDLLLAKIFGSPDSPKAEGFSFLYFEGQNGGEFEKIKALADMHSMKKILNLSKLIRGHKADLDYNINVRLNLASFFSGMHERI